MAASISKDLVDLARSMVEPYWKPEPQRYGFSWWALLLPGIVYTIGVVWYAHNAFVPGLAGVNGHAFGSLLMVAGGEAGTMIAATEVFSKAKKGEAVVWDWLSIAISLVATLGNLFVVYTSLTDIDAWWLPIVRENGPLVLLLCSGVDYYGEIIEFGFFNAGFDARWSEWNDARHTWEKAEFRRILAMLCEDDVADSELDDALAPHKPRTAAQKRNAERIPAKAETRTCEWCGADFANPQALSAHLRFCKARKDAQAAQDALMPAQDANHSA